METPGFHPSSPNRPPLSEWPSTVAENFNSSPITQGELPRIEKSDTHTAMYVRPWTTQAELIGQANQIAAASVDRELHTIEGLIKNPSEASQEEILDYEAQRGYLNTKLGEIGKINVRLREGIRGGKELPAPVRRPGVNTALGALLLATGEYPTKPTAAPGEVQFDENQTKLISENLELAANELREQAKEQSMAALSANGKFAKTAHAYQADGFSKQAQDMRELHDHIWLGSR